MNTTVRIGFSKQARRDRLVWICDSHIAERTESQFRFASLLPRLIGPALIVELAGSYSGVAST